MGVAVVGRIARNRLPARFRYSLPIWATVEVVRSTPAIGHSVAGVRKDRARRRYQSQSANSRCGGSERKNSRMPTRIARFHALLVRIIASISVHIEGVINFPYYTSDCRPNEPMNHFDRHQSRSFNDSPMARKHPRL